MKVGDTDIDSYDEMPLMLTDTGTTLTYLVGETYDRAMEIICRDKNCYTPDFNQASMIVSKCKVEEFAPIHL